MHVRFVIFSLLLLTLACRGLRQPAPDRALYRQLAERRIQLPNQWKLTPAGTEQLNLGDLPLQIAVSADSRLLAVTNSGVATHKIQLFAAGSRPRLLDEITIPKTWYGLAFSSDARRLYASGGHDNLVAVYALDNGQLRRDTTIRLGAPWPHKIGPGGIALDEPNGRLLTVAKEDSALYVCSLATLTVEKRIALPSEPFTVVVADRRAEVYVSLWGAKKVLVFDRATLALKGELPAGDHPNEMTLNRAQTRIFVANSLDNSVSIIDLAERRTSEVLNAALYPDAPNGSTTNSLALSPDESRLYVANADNNCLAVFDVSEPGRTRSLGFVPTGWYPTSVRAVGSTVYVANGKGLASRANPQGPSPYDKAADDRAGQYIGELFPGTLSAIAAPNEAQLATYSRLVYENTPYRKDGELQAEGEAGNPVPRRVGDPSPIKYVFYIIKENRTYDQVLGDMPQGNGDSSLCLFPERITPNQHALASDFVLLDNFYVDAEVSADGHNWSMAAYANDFVEKTWPTSYGGRGGNYDYEGTRRVAFPKNGFIWDYCRRAGISYRTYGEFADDNKPNYETIRDHYCPGYSAWDLNYQDIEREKDWRRDFDSLLAAGQVPRFSTIRFGNDHTSGMARGAYSPEAAVADNDLAVGRFLEHLSHTPIWKESAVFILEDDAQNGADHVDAHRSIAFVVSPYTRRRYVDHTLYSTSSMLRTIELILGLPPMSQYDAAATPMWRCFQAKPDFTPIRAIQPGVPLDTRNAASNRLSEISETFNLAELDAVPDRLFNEVLWKAIKGEHSEMPAPRRAAFVLGTKEKGED